MNITVVCSYANCRNHDKDPNIEINFRDGKIYYMCKKCKKESIIEFGKADSKPLPRSRSMR